ncbi:hypothetical protein [Sulfuricaulis sp.]|jgi:hypothetical protein|uniref:hypothetical protein n=1 Tax=Sulfuricaulis sp. TaxID=2003553 RepID=UPI0035596723
MTNLLQRLQGAGYKTRLQNPFDEFWDWRLGIKTSGYHPGSGQQGDAEWYLHYAPTPYRELFRLFRLVNLGPDDVFTDLGSGMGRAVFAASWMGVRRSVGIELVESLSAKANENLARTNIKGRDVQFRCANALHVNLGDATVLFMFHPFGETTMAQVLAQLHEAREKGDAPPLRIIYRNPVCNHVLEQAGWLRCLARVEGEGPPISTARRYQATLWTTD